jgi:hypothetical protein
VRLHHLQLGSCDAHMRSPNKPHKETFIKKKRSNPNIWPEE